MTYNAMYSYMSTLTHKFILLIIMEEEQHASEAYLESSQTSNMELFQKIVNSFKPFIIFAKSSILYV